jgi:uncharacterized membrane-anchored protein
MDKSSQKPKILKPMMITLAAMAAWAAMHEPVSFDAGSLGVWALEAVAVALLVRAVLALVAPGLGLLAALLQRAMRDMQNSGAES